MSTILSEKDASINLRAARQKDALPLARLLSQIFSAINVTASGNAYLTVSLTSEALKIYGKCSSDSRVSSPESGSAKYHQHRRAMQGVCPDNLLNKKAESTFVQMADKTVQLEVHHA
ncbi:hypothetical protein SODG_003752 [Sodalis praecaptivus]